VVFKTVGVECGGAEVTEELPMGERVAKLESWSAGHEKQCSERYALLMKVISAGAAIALAVAVYGMNRLSGQQDAQMQLLQQLAKAESHQAPDR
jgi:hypothetical protein